MYTGVQIAEVHRAVLVLGRVITRGAIVIIYQRINDSSDVEVLDTQQFGESGIEIHTSDGRSWSGLNAKTANEQLTVLADKYALRVPEECFVLLEAEAGWVEMNDTPEPIDLWGLQPTA